MTLSSKTSVSYLRLLLAVIFIFAVYHIHSLHLIDFRRSLTEAKSKPLSTDGEQRSFLETSSPEKVASARTDPNDILVIMKTGATEQWEKMPTQMATVLKQIPNIIYFSDLEDRIGDIHIMDALKGCNQTLKDTHPDFELYRNQQRLRRLGQRVDRSDPSFSGGWDLDKYKFPHQLQKTWDLWPTAKWYVFIEADTYLSWNNLLRYLDDLDPSEPIYAGKQLFVDGVQFAHGGTGYILSSAAMKRTVGSDPTFAAKYEAETVDVRFGDLILGKAMSDYGINMLDTQSMMRAEPPHIAAYSASDLCLPVLSMHHMSAADMDAMWRLEQEKVSKGERLVFADVYDQFVMPYLTDVRDDWWSLAVHVKYPEAAAQVFRPSFNTFSSGTFESCAEVCDRQQQCVTYSWHEGICELDQVVELGEYRPKSTDGSGFKSGWKPIRIQSLRQMAGHCLSRQSL